MAEVTEDNLMKELYKDVGKWTKGRETLELITGSEWVRMGQGEGKLLEAGETDSCAEVPTEAVVLARRT